MGVASGMPAGSAHVGAVPESALLGALTVVAKGSVLARKADVAPCSVACAHVKAVSVSEVEIGRANLLSGLPAGTAGDVWPFMSA